MLLGYVTELWRHPVKSMRGDRLPRGEVTRDFGVPGDRGWALRDEKVGEIRGGKKLTSLVQFHARYLDEPRRDSTPVIDITFPDGTSMTSEDDRIDTALSQVLGREVSLWPRRPASDENHYRRVSRGSEQDLRAQLGLEPDEPIPDYSKVPDSVMAQIRDYATPRGTYFDAMPLSLLTTTSLNTLAELTPDSVIDSRRFRKNIIIDSDAGLTGFPEFDWVGSRLRLGSAVVEVAAPISRCVMVVLPQDDLPRDRPILRSLVQHTEMNFGVYLRVLTPGKISEGDRVELH